MSFVAQITADITGWEESLNKAGSKLRQFENDVKKSAESISRIGDTLTKVGTKASFLSAGIVAVGTKAFLMASDIEDAVGATEQIFGENANTVNAWASKLDSSFGITKKEALEYSNLMGSMLINIGKLTKDEASKQSAKLIELAGDLTAMYGGSTQDAVRALTGALKGNNTMLDNYGMAVNEALIKQKALELGLISTGGEMTLQAKQAATLALIWEQTGAAQGQAAREADSASGAMRALKTEISNLSTELGEILLPIITPVISRVRDFVSGIRDLSPEAKKMVVVVAGITAAVGPLLLSLGSLLKMLPLITAGFTAITSPIGIAVAAIAGAAILVVKNWDSIKEYFTSGGGAKLFNSIKTLFLTVKDVVSDVFSEIKNTIITIWSAIGDTTKKIWGNTFDSIITTITIAVDIVSGVLNTLISLLKGDFSGALESIKTLAKNVFDGFKNIVFNSLSSMTAALSKFFSFLKLNSLAETFADWSEKIKPSTKKIVDDISTVGEEVEAVTEEIGTLNPEVEALKKEIERLNKEIERLKAPVNPIEALDIFQSGTISEAIRATSGEIKVLGDYLKDLRAGRVEVENVHDEIAKVEERLNVLNTALDTLTGDRELNIKVNTDSALDLFKSTDFGSEAGLVVPVLPKIDTSLLKDGIGDLKAGLTEVAIDVSGMLTDLISGAFASLGDALVNGDNLMQSLGASLLGTLGGILVQLGEMSIAVGVGLEAIKKALSTLNPIVAIAAGAALVALGSMFSAGARKLSQSISGSGGGYSSAPSLRNTEPSYGPSAYRGPYRDDFTVEFKIGSNELVGVLDTAEQRRKRL
jgi:TP901 family phage tail tape measure protein